jgi:hypothetical protein
VPISGTAFFSSEARSLSQGEEVLAGCSVLRAPVAIRTEMAVAVVVRGRHHVLSMAPVKERIRRSSLLARLRPLPPRTAAP